MTTEPLSQVANAEGVTVCLWDSQTGRWRHAITGLDEWSWTYGNWGDDCNRYSYFDLPDDPTLEAGYCVGAKRFLAFPADAARFLAFNESYPDALLMLASGALDKGGPCVACGAKP